MPGVKASVARASARVEASLSTHAFLYLSLYAYAITTALFAFAGFRAEWTKEHLPVKRWFISLARAAGYALNFNTPLLLLLASRLFHTLLRLTPFGAMLPLDHFFPRLHILVAYVVAVALLVHVPAHFVWIIVGNEWGWGLWNVNMTVITGILLLLLFFGFMFFSRPAFRSKSFHLFRLIHIVSAALFFPLLVLHGMYNFKPETYKYIVPAMAIYLLDRVVRRLALRSHAVSTTLNPADSAFLNPTVLRLRLPRSFAFRPGQYAELRVPQLGREWHPFTIASAPHDDHLTFYIKDLGDWTHALHAAVRTRLALDDPEAPLTTDDLEPLCISVRGPYGAPAQQFDQFDRIILVSGGIGATPFVSICRHVEHFHKSRGLSRPTDMHSEPVSRSNATRAGSSSSSSSSSSSPSSPSASRSISKHHPSVSTTAEAEKRLRVAVSDLFNVDVAAPDPFGEVERRGNQVAEMIRLASRRSARTLLSGSPSPAPPGTSRATFCEPPSRERVVVDSNPARSADALFDLESGALAAERRASWLEEAASVVTGWTRESVDVSTERRRRGEAADEKKAAVPRNHTLQKDHRRATGAEDDEDDTSRLPNASFFDGPPSSFARTRRLARRELARLDRTLTELLQFLHTTRVSFVLLLFLVARAGVLGAGLVTGSDFVRGHNSGTETITNPQGVWVVIVQAALYAPVVLTLFATNVLEMKLVGASVMLASARRLSEAVLFGPVSTAALAMEIRRAVLGTTGREVEVLARYGVVLPLTLVAVAARLWRSIGRRGLLVGAEEEGDEKMVGERGPGATGSKKSGGVPGVDFVWTTPKFEDDRWLRAELGDVAGPDGAVRLHRFATREKGAEEEDEEESEFGVGREWRTRAGRPDWEKVFGQVAMEVNSDSTVGVFFCGPHAMGRAVREAAKKMEMWSNLKAAYLRSTPDDTVMEDLGLRSRGTLDAMRRVGCRVRFVYREENFN